jgi:flagellar biosynthetic protein FliR
MQELLNRLGVNVNVAFHLVFFSLVWVRVLAMTAVLPFLFGKPVPRYVMVAGALALAIFVYPNIVPAQQPVLTDDWLALSMLYLKEIFYGLCLGMAVGMLFHAFASVGQMVDNQRGMAIARVLIPALGQQMSISSIFMYQLGIVIYLSAGGHRYFFNSFFHSFKALPVLDFPVAGPGLFPMIDLFIRISGQVIALGIQMAAPIIIAIFFADIILGMANRIAPQINVWMLGFTMKGYIGVLLLFVSITMIGDRMYYYSMKSNTYAEQVSELLQGRVPEGAPEPPVPEEGLPKPEEGPPPVVTP